ncbi:MAG: bifunctional 5,10-methylenetetrahydrofolate dehydrogenase/5,10-methenyltetrahydrofolate cyclohydrolase [Candidatus Moranbacteria bacterium]|nr:bifunctional 5,10-methylenetetrahydrofolate dehydrogenase/5,10-methenyltetrahydrofolate cyclohydrolase [Candidatus Moranbacteria bacterium]NTW46430.1 bifunctional 5,10-methylenetetrahydrofolate dehydrogenase/5,10-methenyltetrahydrofolate cyclohydrolase [Candidatus Moranbacteria bacterium]
MILSGKQVAETVFAETRDIVSGLPVRPGLAVVLVGDDPASHLYVGIKERRAAELGFVFRREELSAEATDDEIISVIDRLNDDPGTHGIIVQLPLPAGHDADRVVAAIDPSKDADGFHPETVARFLAGERGSVPVFPAAIMALAKSSGVPLSGKRGIVVVNSERFGDVMKRALGNEGVEASVILSSDIDPRKDEIATADVVVTAIGQAERFPRNLFGGGAIVVDGGIAERDGEVLGDIAKDSDGSHIFLSPVPGGVGPVTVACLLRRTAQLASSRI